MEKTYDIDYYVVQADTYDEHSFKKIYTREPASFSTIDETVIPQKGQYIMTSEKDWSHMLFRVLDVILQIHQTHGQKQSIWDDSIESPHITGAMVILEKLD